MDLYKDYLKYDRQNPEISHINFGEPLECQEAENLSVDSITKDETNTNFYKFNAVIQGYKKDLDDITSRLFKEIKLTFFHRVYILHGFYGFLPSGALLFYSNEKKILLEDSLYMSLFHFHPLIRNDKSTNWNWRLNPNELSKVAFISNQILWCYHRFYFQYYHWFIDCLPRLWVAQNAKINYDKIFFGNISKIAFATSSLKAFGIDQNKFLVLNEKDTYKFSNVIYPSSKLIETSQLRPSLGSGIHFKAGWDPKYLKELNYKIRSFYNVHLIEAKEMIYVSRSDASHRNVKNETLLIKGLIELGFKIISPGTLSFENQVKTFASAKLIVGCHGAGLTNILWSKRKEANLIEFFVDGMGDPGYKVICDGLEINYYPVKGTPLKNSKHGIAFDDISVNFGEVFEKISKLI